MNRRIIDVIRSNLIRQMVYFDEQLTELLIKVFPQISERNKIGARIEHYRQGVSEILAGTYPGEPEQIVLIGAHVTIQYENDNQAEKYTIVLPDHANIDEGCISFVSPLGSQLLLSQVGDSVCIESPSDSYTVKVGDVAYIT